MFEHIFDKKFKILTKCVKKSSKRGSFGERLSKIDYELLSGSLGENKTKKQVNG